MGSRMEGSGGSGSGTLELGGAAELVSTGQQAPQNAVPVEAFEAEY